MIRCVAIDDEPIALGIINEYCKKMGDVCVECFTSPSAGMNYINESKPDIVFLDIEMNSYNGIELAKSLPKGICLIFTTAYAEYALDGFNVDAIDFLHKPIFFTRFERAIQKAKIYIDKTTSSTNNDSKVLTIREGYKNVILDTDEIVLLEAMDNYIKIHRKNLSTVVPQITMKEMEKLLPADKFIRVHRSYIVPVASIEKYSNRTVILKDYTNPIPIGRKYIENINNLNNQYQSLK